MKKVLNFNRPSGSRKMKEPKVIGEVLNEYFRSNNPLAVAYRDHLFVSLFPDTHLAVNLKLVTRKPERMPVGEYLDGMITRDDEDHFSFVENFPGMRRTKPSKRNPHVFDGKYVTLTRRDDGSLRPNFCRPQYSDSFTIQDFCREAAIELLALAGLVGEMTI